MTTTWDRDARSDPAGREVAREALPAILGPQGGSAAEAAEAVETVETVETVDRPSPSGRRARSKSFEVAPVGRPALPAEALAPAPVPDPAPDAEAPGAAGPPSTPDPGRFGYLDAVEGGTASGWACMGRERTEVVILVDGVEAARTSCGEPRPDLAAHGIGEGCGFRVEVPAAAEGRLLEACFADGMALLGSPFALRAPEPAGSGGGVDAPVPDAASRPVGAMRGNVDNVSTRLVDGWAACGGVPSAVEVLVDGAVVATLGGNRYRSDLFDHGLDPHCGFEHRFAHPIARGSVVEVRHLGDAGVLEGSPRAVAQVPLGYRRPQPCEDGPVHFIHIPKTAGTSLNRSIDAAVPDRVRIYSGEMHDPAFLADFASRPRPPLVIGHFSYGVHAQLGLPPRYVTVLRDPVARVASLLRYCRAMEFPYLMGFSQRTMLEVVSSCYTEQTNNHMCRVLSGITADQGMLIGERWLLDLAWHNVERHFDLVGTLDDLPRYQEALGSLIGRDLGPVRGENVGFDEGPDEELSVALGEIRAKNALDIELYERVLDHGCWRSPRLRG